MKELEAEDWTFHIIKNCVTNYLLLKMAHFDVSHTHTKKDSSNKILNLFVIKEGSTFRAKFNSFFTYHLLVCFLNLWQRPNSPALNGRTHLC